MLAGNPELQGPELPDAEIEPKDWRLLHLRMQKSNGSHLEVELLRPIEWILTQALSHAAGSPDPTFGSPRPLTVAANELALAEFLLDREINLDLPELGASGPATVLSIAPCPSVEPAGRAGRRIVTGTFHHSAANVIHLQIEGEPDTIGTTDNHPFWSADRHEFVEAGQLRLGETLLLANGTPARLTRVTPHTGPPAPVFNLEVDADHTYHVGANGVLVHNECTTGQWHHIVSIYDNLKRPLAAAAIREARDILRNAHLDIKCRGIGNNLRQIPGHSGPHPIAYHQEVARVLREVTNGLTPRTREYREATEAGLNALRYMIRSGDLPLN